MSTFHTLNLRENSKNKEKVQEHKAQSKQRQKGYLRELLTHKIIKKYTDRRNSEATASQRAYLSTTIAKEVDIFLES